VIARRDAAGKSPKIYPVPGKITVWKVVFRGALGYNTYKGIYLQRRIVI